VGEAEESGASIDLLRVRSALPASRIQEISEREVRDLPCFEYSTTVVVETYRMKCPRCGFRAEKVPQLPSKAPFSKRFEEAVGQACESASARQVARRLGMAESTVRAIDLRCLERWEAKRRKPPLRQMGVDELYRGKQDKFLTVVCNLETGEPLWFGKTRKKETLDEFFRDELWPRVGNWKHEHLFTLKQSRQIYQQYQDWITACDAEIEKLVVAFEPRVDPAERPLPPDRKEKPRKRKKRGAIPGTNPKTGFDMRTEAYQLFGVDVTRIPGLMMTPLKLFSEVGRDMSRWPTADHFASWLGLCPDNDISGGRVLWKGMRGTRNQAGQLFRMAAFGLHHELSPMGDHLRRMKSKIGPAAAQTATAHKIAIIFYTMLKKQVEYDASIWAQKDAEREKRFEAKLKRQAQARGYKLVKIEETIAA
jgi:hypothetical protein